MQAAKLNLTIGRIISGDKMPAPDVQAK